MRSVLFLCCLLTAFCPGLVRAQATISHGTFDGVAVYQPTGTVQSFVLFLSDGSGWSHDTDAMARVLAAEGAMVAGIDTPKWLAALDKDGGDCVLPDGQLEELSHFLQAHARLPAYYTPQLMGFHEGATLAYAMLAQAPPDIFAGAVSVGFCADIDLRRPLCKGNGLESTRRADGRGFRFAPVPLRNPWTALHAKADAECPFAAAKTFVAQTPGAAFVPLDAGYAATARWAPRLVAAYRGQLARRKIVPVRAPAALTDLPIVEVPVKGAGDTFAVMISGDGGWAGLDKEVAKQLAARGVPVAGWDSLRYFWDARTPAGIAADLDRVVRYYAQTWNRPQVILIGYSQGADVLSFAVNRLPTDSRARVTKTVLISPGLLATFEFHVSSWLGGSGDVPILPEALKLPAASTVCLYGQDEGDSLCPKLADSQAHVRALPGGHHYNGDYGHVAGAILEQLD